MWSPESFMAESFFQSCHYFDNFNFSPIPISSPRIDHWDNEREKIVILSDFSMLVIRYDFVNDRVQEWKRVFLHLITSLQLGDFVYPQRSLMPWVPLDAVLYYSHCIWMLFDPGWLYVSTQFRSREHGGIRLFWGSPDELTFGQRWNPWASDIPYITFAHHIILYNNKERETVTYNVDDCCDSIQEMIKKAHNAKGSGNTLEVKEEPILIESYASVSSMIFNQSHLGFNKDRNGLSFWGLSLSVCNVLPTGQSLHCTLIHANRYFLYCWLSIPLDHSWLRGWAW